MTRLLLVGAGHAHVQLLRDWARRPLAGIELVLVTPGPLAPYSGMVPGWLAGAYRFEQACIDAAALARAAGATLVIASLHALDADRRTATLDDGTTLAWDWLSLNHGSTLDPPAGLGTPAGATAAGVPQPAAPPALLMLRPLAALQPAWDAVLARHAADPDPQPLRLLAAGGGAAGIEALLAVHARLRALCPQRPVQATLVTRGPALLPGLAPGAVRAAHRALQRIGATVRTGTDCTPALAAGQHLVLWATGAVPHAWQRDPARRGGLAVDGAGFVQVDGRLRSVSHPRVFAVGDCAGHEPPLPKAGVHAVRQGPVLAAELRAALTGAPPPPAYVPQRQFLVLLATGDGRAIASRGRLWAEGRWVWRWKDWIDRRFVGGF